MQSSFERSFTRMTRALRADDGVRSTALTVVALLLLAAWLTWAVETHSPLLRVVPPSRLTGAAVGER